MPIYMNYNDIKGDVAASGHEGWVELHSLSWSAGRCITSPVGASADRESSAPTISEINVTKATDIASTKLLNEAYQGEGQKVVIDFCKTDAGTLEIYMQYTLEDCLISNYSVSSGGDRPTESLSLNFTKVEFKNIAMKDKNDAGDPDAVTYDLAQAMVV